MSGFDGTILVTGATGGFGGYAIASLERLVGKGHVIGLARSEEKAGKLTDRGIAIRIGDYDDPESLRRAFDGVDRLLFVSGAPGDRETEHGNVVRAARDAGIGFIAYTSFPQATSVSNMLSADHVFTEGLLAESGITHAFLRNNWYLENELALIGIARSTGELPFAAGQATIGWALKREYAEAAARVVSADDPRNETLELSGPLRSYADLAAAVSRVTGKPVTPRPVTAEGFATALKAAGLPDGAVKGLTGVQTLVAAGDLEVASTDFVRTLGHPLLPLDEALKEIL